MPYGVEEKAKILCKAAVSQPLSILYLQKAILKKTNYI